MSHQVYPWSLTWFTWKFPHLGDLLTMVIKHLLTGMILQVVRRGIGWSDMMKIKCPLELLIVSKSLAELPGRWSLEWPLFQRTFQFSGGGKNLYPFPHFLPSLQNPLRLLRAPGLDVEMARWDHSGPSLAVFAAGGRCLWVFVRKKTPLIRVPRKPSWVVVSNIFYFQPYLGKIPILTNIFQMGWNHQLASVPFF